MTEFLIKTYKIMLSEGGKTLTQTGHNSVFQSVSYKAHIAVSDATEAQLRLKDPQKLHAVANIFFVESMREVPDNQRNQVGLQFYLYMPMDRYPAVVDLLRNEEPVFFYFDSAEPSESGLHTGPEPAGEGEQLPSLTIDKAEIEIEDSGEDDLETPGGFSAFQHQADNHAWSNSYLLALVSDHVYGGGEPDYGSAFVQKFSDIYTPWLSAGGRTDIRFDMISEETQAYAPGGGTQAVVMSNNAFIALIFRGSEQFPLGPDWINNLRGVPVPILWAGPTVGTHSGFLVALERVYQQILDLIEQHRGTGNKPLWIAGHSLGGSLASICALRLQMTGDYPVQGVCTYGSSPVAAFGFSLSYAQHGLHERTQRWVNNNDPVANMRGLRPVGQRHFIDAVGTATLYTPDPPRLSLYWPNFDDHERDVYCEKIYDNLPATIRSSVPIYQSFEDAT